MKKYFIAIVMAMTVSISAQAQNDEINNATVLQLLKEGFTSEEIIGAIEASSTRTITYSLDYMRELKAAGADSNLTTYIQKIAKVDYGMEGVIWWNTGEKPKKVLRSQFEKESKGFNLGAVGAAALTGGALAMGFSGSTSATAAAALGAGSVLLMTSGKDIQKLCIMGQTSKNVIKTKRPVFRFYLPKQGTESFAKEASTWYQNIMTQVQSPNEFQVVKMKQKKNRRVFTDNASYSIAGFEGSNSKSRVVVDFEINEINNNTFEITFNQDFEPGEYVWFWKNGLGSEEFKQHVFGFDFSIQDSATSASEENK